MLPFVLLLDQSKLKSHLSPRKFSRQNLFDCVLRKIWRKSKSVTDHNKFKERSRLVAKLVTQVHRDYYKAAISNASSSPRKLWTFVNPLLFRSASLLLHSMSSTEPLSTCFLKFFTDKITKLYSSLQPDNISPYTDPIKVRLPSRLLP